MTPAESLLGILSQERPLAPDRLQAALSTFVSGHRHIPSMLSIANRYDQIRFLSVLRGHRMTDTGRPITDDRRHSLTCYLFGGTSVKSLCLAQIEALILWLSHPLSVTHVPAELNLILAAAKTANRDRPMPVSAQLDLFTGG